MNCEWASFILTTQTRSLGNVLLSTQATSSLRLQSATIKLPVLGESGFLVQKFYAAFKSENFPTLPSTIAGSARLPDTSAELVDTSTLYTWPLPVKTHSTTT